MQLTPARIGKRRRELIDTGELTDFLAGSSVRFLEPRLNDHHDEGQQNAVGSSNHVEESAIDIVIRIERGPRD